MRATLVAVTTTVASRDDALRLARALVERRLAACAQITAIESVYRWQGEIVHEPEWRVLFKTAAEAYAPLEAAIRDLHPYELPAIYAVAVDEASAAYADWVVAQTGEPR